MRQFPWIFLGLVFRLLSFNPASAADAPKDFTLDRVDGGTLLFKTQPPLKTALFEVKFLAQLPPDGGTDPYFLITALPCATCAQDRSVYVVRPGLNKAAQFVYPGKISDPKTRALLYDSRAFYGKCVREKAPLYISYQKERIDRKKSLQISAFIAEPQADHLDEELLERHYPALQNTLKMVKQKLCFELEGRSRLMSSKPFDLKVRKNLDQEEEEEESTKENQTNADLGAAPADKPAQ